MEAVVILGIIGANLLFDDNKYDKNPPNVYSDSSLEDIKVKDESNNDMYDLNNYHESSKIIKSSAKDMIQSLNNDAKHIESKRCIDNNKDRANKIYTNINTNSLNKNNPSDYSNLTDYYKNNIIDSNKTLIDTSNASGVGFSYVQSDLNGNVNLNPNTFLKNNYGFSANGPNREGTIDYEDNYNRYLDGGSGAQVKVQKNVDGPSNLGDLWNKQNVYQSSEHLPLSKERYNISKYMNNIVLPDTNKKIAPIIDRDPINGDVGRLIANRNKIDNIRTINNQKETYEGDIIVGKNNIDKSTLHPSTVNKYKPYRDYKNTPDRYLVTTGSVIGDTSKPSQIIKATNRSVLNKEILGNAGNINGVTKESNRASIKYSTKQQLSSDTVRNFTGSENNQIEYGNLGFECYPNEREVTTERTHNTNLTGHLQHTITNQDKLKNTTKETTENNNHNGNLSSMNESITQYPTDKLRNTTKTTTEKNNNVGNLTGLTRPTIGNQQKLDGTIKQGTLYSTLVNPKSQIDNTINVSNYENAVTNATKEILSQLRAPTQVSTNIPSGVDAENMEIKKIESDYLTHQIKGKNKVYQLTQNDECCEYTKNKMPLNDEQRLLDQIDPNILNPFKDNPYTHSLSSHAFS